MSLLLLLRVTLAPLLILGGSLAQRRWGQAIGGRLFGLPLTSLPLLVLLSLSDGPRFASSAAAAGLAGGVAQSAWCLVYALAVRRHGPATALVGATGVFAAVCVVLDRLPVPTVVGAALAAASILATLHWWPAAGPTATTGGAARHEVPVRMVAAAVFTLALSGSAASLGARPAGLVGAFPLITVILAVGTHHRDGSVAANRFLHGVMTGSFSVVASLLVLALTLPVVPLAVAIPLAVAAALMAQLVPTGRTGRAAGASGGPKTGAVGGSRTGKAGWSVARP